MRAWLADLGGEISDPGGPARDEILGAVVPSDDRLALLVRFRGAGDLGFLVRLGALLDQDARVGDAAIAELATSDIVRLPALGSLVRGAASSDLRWKIVRALGMMPCGGPVACILAAATDDPDLDVRVAALRGLGGCGRGAMPVQRVFLDAIHGAKTECLIRREAAFAMLRVGSNVDIAVHVLRNEVADLNRAEIGSGLRSLAKLQFLNRIADLGESAAPVSAIVLELMDDCGSTEEAGAQLELEREACWAAARVLLALQVDERCRHLVEAAFSQSVGRKKVAAGLVLLAWGQEVESEDDVLSRAIQESALFPLRTAVGVIERRQARGQRVMPATIEALTDVLESAPSGLDVKGFALRGLLASGSVGAARLKRTLRESSANGIVRILSMIEDMPDARGLLREEVRALCRSQDWRIRKLASALTYDSMVPPLGGPEDR